MSVSTVLLLAVSVAIEVWMPEMGGIAVKDALARKAVLGIQYCGNHLCSQTSFADVVSKMVAPARTPRMRFCTEMIFGRYSAFGLKSLPASSVILWPY